MPYGLTTFQLLSILVPIAGAILTSLNYLFQFDKQEHSRMASLSESERWEVVKENYGEMVWSHHNEIEDTANLFLNIDDQDDYVETIAEIVGDTDKFQELQHDIERMSEPKQYLSRCRKGAEFSPWAFLLSTGLAIGAVLSEQYLSFGLLILSILTLVVAFALTTGFLYYRSKLNGLSDEVRFRT